MINAIGIALQGLGFATKQVAESANKIANPQEGVELAEEIVKMKIAETSYKANLMTIRVAEDMEKDLLRTFDEKV
jgi:flagellar basal body rod protein FlgC